MKKTGGAFFRLLSLSREGNKHDGEGMRLNIERFGLVGIIIFVLLLVTALPTYAQQDGKSEPPRTQLTLERTLIERGGLLLPPGTMEVEPAFEYQFFSTRRIDVSGFSILPTLIIGVLETEKVQRDILDASLTTRLGLIRDIQFEVRIPYRFAFDRISTETTETKTNDNHIGDIEMALSYQPVKERGWIPDVILGIRGKTITGQDPFSLKSGDIPTGTGLYSLTGTLTAVKSSDPAVIFGGLSVTHNFGRKVLLALGDASRTEIDPGFTIGYNVGFALAVSIDLSFSMRLQQSFTSKTETRVSGGNKNAVPGSTLNVAIATFGITWAITQTMSADISVGIGLTEDSPDVTVRLAFPVRFSNVFAGFSNLFEGEEDAS